VDDDEPAAALEEGVEVGAVGSVGNVAALLRVDKQDVGGGELLGAGKRVASRGAGAALVEERDPLREKARVVVLAGAVRLRTGADEDAKRRLCSRGRERDAEREQSEGEGAFHRRRVWVLLLKREPRGWVGEVKSSSGSGLAAWDRESRSLKRDFRHTDD
jgi:hypothetical protein